MTPEPPAEIRAVAAWLAGYCGISTTIIGEHSLRRAIRLRQQATGLSALPAYQDLLQASPEEQQSLVELVVVPETWFFRDRQPFAHLREHVTRLQQGAPLGQPLRLLSAPCASGEEPYSMAMTLLAMGLPRESFSIDAIDICRQSIRKARRAVYGRHSFRGVSEAEQQQHFVNTPEGLALKPEIRQAVHFRRANLMQGLAEAAGRYDVIFCRNLLIYLEDTASQHLLESLAALLRSGGLLIVGSAETGKVPLALFQPIRESFVFGFLRRQPQPDPPLPVLPPAPSSGQGSREHPATPPPPRRRASTRSVRRAPSPLSGSSPEALAPSRPILPAEASSGAEERELQRLRQELQRDPSSDQTYLQLGQWLLRRKRLEEAVDCLQKCLYLKPDCREALIAMIQLCDQLGQVERRRQFQGRLARLETWTRSPSA